MTDILYNTDRILVTLLYNTKRFYGTKDEQGLLWANTDEGKSIKWGKELFAIRKIMGNVVP